MSQKILNCLEKPGKILCCLKKVVKNRVLASPKNFQAKPSKFEINQKKLGESQANVKES